VLNVAYSNIDCFLCRNACVSSTQLNSPIGAKRDYLYLETMMFKGYSFQKLTQFSQESNVLDAPVSNTDCFLSRDTCVSST
jgi:hypothetical protein